MPTILELFQNSGLNQSVKKDTETLVEQETNGIRIQSAVELNNPLIYGNEAIRIAQRTTDILDEMKSSTSGDTGGGGLNLNKKISGAKNFVNDKLGIPSTQTPTRVVEDIKDKPSNEPILLEGNGTGLGKFLKDSGGGNLSTIGTQVAGNAVGVAKDKLRGAIFGESPTIGENVPPTVETTTNKRTYSEVSKSKKLITSKEELEDSKIDLSLVSPIYGLKRNDGRFGRSEYAFVARNSSGEVLKELNGDTYDNPKTSDNISSWLNNSSWIGGSSLADENGKYKVIGEGEVSKEDLEKYDLIPFWISGLDSSKATFFRAVITGLSETTTPTWSSGKFVGNPYNYYTYEGVERSVTFNMNIYCMNPDELMLNWEKITYLTKKVYPHINDNLVNPPFIKFRMGDLYNGKVGFVESLTYTFPDSGNWETTLDGGRLPKFIDVSMTIKFVEMPGSELSLYSYSKSPEAIEAIKEESKSNGGAVSTDTQTGEGSEVKVTVNNSTGEVSSSPESEAGSGTKSAQGGAAKTPEQIRQEKREAYSSKLAAKTKERLDKLKGRGFPDHVVKHFAQNHGALINTITKHNETTYFYTHEGTFGGRKISSEMVGRDRGGGSFSSINRKYWNG